ncbi:MAG TPA: hypothetical protein VFB42_02805 [Gaiellaceae bacterium]|nr:hypothetical protein [Gaiellaceae bacterium]
MRLRPLSEAECYTRCYGGRPGERVSVVRVVARAARRAEQAPQPAKGRRAA